ncbi:hypothetical protein NODU109028_20925 [Nocardioides dubius]|uniref:DUF2530 domain-containing protein n=1 Tax=Nocardioides dubius TaxID=317019 RepID=A0ABP4EA48_9ACTN
MKPQDEDEAWRQIVENYGDTPRADEIPLAESTPEPAPAEPLRVDAVEPAVEEPPAWAPEPEEPAELAYRAWDDEGRFVPPTPPPIGWATPPRLVAWVGLFGVPLLFLVCLFTGLTLPSIINLILIGWFVGGFCYLVWNMPRTRNDPWDDGSRI